MKRVMLFLAVAVLLSAGPALAADWQLTTSKDGFPEVYHQGSPLLAVSTPFWGAKWKYAGCSWQKTGKTVSGSVGNLDLTINGTISSPAPNKMQFRYEFDAASSMSSVIGGGFEFNLKLDSPTFAGKAAAPVLLANNAGWRWEPLPGQAVEVRFFPSLAKVNFERGQKNRIRAFVYSGAIQAGPRKVTMMVTLPQGARTVTAIADRYGEASLQTWPGDLFAWNKSPVDLSFLNHRPAGKFGPVRVQKDKLVFENGGEARFWGTNIQAYALFETNDENIPIQAGRIARLGMNLVRIHHHDSGWTPNVFGGRYAFSTRELDPEMMDKLDRWIKALRDEGIYVWLDLHVGREFRRNDDIEKFDDFSRENIRSEGKGYCYLNAGLQKRMQEFNEQYLTHVNPHTGMAYRDDPALMGILVTNENDVTIHFGNSFLPDKGVPLHNRLFNQDRRKFCDRTGLNFRQAGMTWLPGESKIYLNDLEHRFNLKMLSHLREQGIRVPMATTNLWGNGAAFCLPALSDSTIIDTHGYGSGEELSWNPRFQAGFLTQVSLGAIYGKPLAVSEWNVGEDGITDRFYMPVFTSAIASLQGWDALMLYGYAQVPLNGQSRLRNWSSFNDPAIMGVMPAAAVMYRQGHVAPAKKTYCLKLDREDLFFKAVSGQTSAAVRTLLEQSRFTVGLPATRELPWLRETRVPDETIVVTEPNQDFLPRGQCYVESDTREIRREWQRGIQVIDTPRSQVVCGWIGGESLHTADCSFAVQTRNALVAVQGLGAAPIRTSERILITVMARVRGDDQRGAPFFSEPVTGVLSIRAPEGRAIVPLKPDGSEGPPLPAQYRDGRYTITLGDQMRSHWFLLR